MKRVFPLLPPTTLCHVTSRKSTCGYGWHVALVNAFKVVYCERKNEPPQDKAKCTKSDASDQPGNFRDLTGLTLFQHASSCVQRSDWVDVQTDLSLLWVLMRFCLFYHAVAHICIFADGY